MERVSISLLLHFSKETARSGDQGPATASLLKTVRAQSSFAVFSACAFIYTSTNLIFTFSHVFSIFSTQKLFAERYTMVLIHDEHFLCLVSPVCVPDSRHSLVLSSNFLIWPATL